MTVKKKWKNFYLPPTVHAAVVQIHLTFVLFVVGCTALLQSNDDDTVIIPCVMV